MNDHPVQILLYNVHLVIYVIKRTKIHLKIDEHDDDNETLHSS